MEYFLQMINISQMINSYIKQINQQTKRIKTTFYKLAFETWSWSQMQSTSRYRELIVMDAVHNKQPKKLQQSRQFILCMISRFVLEFMMLQAVLHEFFPTSFERDTHYFLMHCINATPL